MSKPSLVVFAAGRGTRMQPLIQDLPKAMLPVLDVPLIDLALGRGEGMDWAGRFVNVSGPSPGLREHLAAHHPGVEVFDEGEAPIGQAATLWALRDRLSGTVVTYNCDLVSDLDTGALLAHHRAAEPTATLAVQPVETGADLIEERGRLSLIDRRSEDSSGYLYLGAACFSRALIGTIGRERPLGLSEGLLRPAIDRGDAGLLTHGGYARDTGTPAGYLQVSLDALDPRRLTIATPGVLTPEGGYLGPGARASGSAGRGSILLAGSHLQEGARATDCIIGPKAIVPTRTRVRGGIWWRDHFFKV